MGDRQAVRQHSFAARLIDRRFHAVSNCDTKPFVTRRYRRGKPHRAAADYENVCFRERRHLSSATLAPSMLYRGASAH